MAGFEPPRRSNSPTGGIVGAGVISTTGRTGDGFAAVGSALCGTPRTELHRSKAERSSGVNMISLREACRRADYRISVPARCRFLDWAVPSGILQKRERGRERERGRVPIKRKGSKGHTRHSLFLPSFFPLLLPTSFHGFQPSLPLSIIYCITQPLPSRGMV